MLQMLLLAEMFSCNCATVLWHIFSAPCNVLSSSERGSWLRTLVGCIIHLQLIQPGPWSNSGLSHELVWKQTQVLPQFIILADDDCTSLWLKTKFVWNMQSEGQGLLLYTIHHTHEIVNSSLKQNAIRCEVSWWLQWHLLMWCNPVLWPSPSRFSLLHLHIADNRITAVLKTPNNSRMHFSILTRVAQPGLPDVCR